jgi:hypothetical protein
VQPTADDPNRRDQPDHAPTVKDPCEKIGDVLEVHDGASKRWRRRYVKDELSVKGLERKQL